MCERAELFDPGGSGESTSTLFGLRAMAFRVVRGRRLRANTGVSGLDRPARSRALLRFAVRSPCTVARTGLPGGGLLPG